MTVTPTSHRNLVFRSSMTTTIAVLVSSLVLVDLMIGYHLSPAVVVHAFSSSSSPPTATSITTSTVTAPINSRGCSRNTVIPSLFLSIPTTVGRTTKASKSKTTLFAVGALVKKAKEVELRKYVADGIEENVMEQYKRIEQALSQDNDSNNDDDEGNLVVGVGPLQETLTRRKGTITVIAEYKRKFSSSTPSKAGAAATTTASTTTTTTAPPTPGSTTTSAIIDKDIFSPELLSSEFREFGAHGIAVLADERMGGCTYDDLQTFVEDQRRSKNSVPGPVHVINSDIIVDEIQIARTAAVGASAVVLSLDLLGTELTTKLIRASMAVDLEVIVSVSTKEQAQTAIDIGARMISVVNVPGVDAKLDVISDLKVPEGATITTIANILHRSDKGLAEVEEAWACRDKGFNCAWISDALYKAGNSANEHPGAIIKSMASKSSVRWASPVARSGRGEGAREYLGDIMM